jgi:hypothetical protein
MDEIRNRYRAPRRDYGGPVRRPAAPLPHHQAPMAAAAYDPGQPEPAPHLKTPAPQHRRPKKHRLLRFLILLIILAALAGGGWYAHQKYFVKNPFPADIRKNAAVDLLYPAKLPPGYRIDPASIQQTNGILLYDAVNGGQRLVFSLQKTPPTFDFTTFYKQQLQNNQQFSTAYGQAAVGRNGGRYLGSLVDGGTWLILSANNSRLNAADFSLVLNNLKKY